MNTNCYEIGTIQAFLDGELSPDKAAKITSHIALCDSCAIALADAEDESAVVFSALDRELNSLVPTQRLWSKINDSIEVEKQNSPYWRRIWLGLNGLFSGPSLAMAAGLAIVFGISIAVMNSKTEVQAPVPAPAADDALTAQNRPSTVPAIEQPTALSRVDEIATAKAPRYAQQAVDRDSNTRPQPVNASYVPDRRPAQPAAERPSVNTAGYLPGEESYVKTIANLSQTVSGQKDTALRPSERVSYERDMAVVDDAISRMRKEIRKNPKSESARQVLYTSYQNKIDLLNSVSQKEELMASLK